MTYSAAFLLLRAVADIAVWRFFSSASGTSSGWADQHWAIVCPGLPQYSHTAPVVLCAAIASGRLAGGLGGDDAPGAVQFLAM